jgi:hypothetical protein
VNLGAVSYMFFQLQLASPGMLLFKLMFIGIIFFSPLSFSRSGCINFSFYHCSFSDN